MLKRSSSWSPRRPLSLPVNRASCCSYPCVALSWIWAGPMTKKTQSDIVWLPRLGHKKPCYLRLDLSIHPLLGYFCSEQLPCCERHKAHGEATCRHPSQQPASVPAIWGSQCGHPAQVSLQMTPALASTWLQQHERPQVRTAQLSPVNPQNHEK